MPTVISDARGPFGRNVPPAARDPRRRARGRPRDAGRRRRRHLHLRAGRGDPARAARPTSSAAARQTLADPDWFRRCASACGGEVRRCTFTNYCEGLDQSTSRSRASSGIARSSTSAACGARPMGQGGSSRLAPPGQDPTERRSSEAAQQCTSPLRDLATSGRPLRLQRLERRPRAAAHFMTPATRRSTALAGIPRRGRYALVNGGGGGAGAAIAARLAAHGAAVLVAARTREEVDRVAAALRASGAHANAATCDVSSENRSPNWRPTRDRRRWTIDILVNNAGRGRWRRHSCGHRSPTGAACSTSTRPAPSCVCKRSGPACSTPAGDAWSMLGPPRPSP